MLAPGSHRLRDVIALALHAPGSGYYACHVRTIGRAGDFSTSATTGNSLANAIARWATAAAATGDIRHIIEVGAGDGSLAAGILSALPWLHPLRRGYFIVDTSPPLRAQQAGKLGKKTRWFDTMPEALAACGGKALIIGNELVDAFPPTVVQWNGSDWQEVALDISDDGIVRETLLAWEDPSVPCVALDSQAWPHGHIPDGQRIELLVSFQQWLAGWLPDWHQGACLWIDYGSRFPEIYHRRPRGTLRAYYRHERLEGMDVFRRLGRQDITCDVNFTDLQAWGELAGLQTQTNESQKEFIARHAAAIDGDPAASADVGHAFRVLCQIKADG